MVLVLQQNRWPWRDVSDKGAFVKTVFASRRQFFYFTTSCFAPQLDKAGQYGHFQQQIPPSPRIFIAIIIAKNDSMIVPKREGNRNFYISNANLALAPLSERCSSSWYDLKL